MERYLSTINTQEIAQFSKMAEGWWDETGPFKLLHQMNLVRLKFIKEQLCRYFNLDSQAAKPFVGLRILDIGCGGGILTEPLARLGAHVTGIDASAATINVAQSHAKNSQLDIRYLNIALEDLQKTGEAFDVVITLEVIEHVTNVKRFLKTTESLMAKNGALILSTINRSPQSFLGAIIAAEYILKWIPKGTHHWEQFLKPSELVSMLEVYHIRAKKISGMSLNPFTKTWSLSQKPEINYILFGTH